MDTASKSIDTTGIGEAVFERGDDVRLAGPLAALAWCAVTLLAWLWPHALQSDWAHIATTASAVVACMSTAAVVTAERSQLSRRALKLAPWLLILAAVVDVLLVVKLDL